MSKSNKRYYWLKLHEEFFNQPVMKMLRKLPDGDKILIIYLKLLLISLRTDGYIYLEGLCPTMEEELALILDEEPTLVKFALPALKQVRLLEYGSEPYEICMTKFPEMVGVGTETFGAARMRSLREQRTISEKGVTLLPPVTECDPLVTACDTPVTKCYTEKEIDIEKDKETEKEKRVETHSENLYGVNQNIRLSDAELTSLKQQFPDYLAKIDYLSSYMASTGKNYHSHYLTIVQWAKKDEQKTPKQEPKKPGFPDYSYKKGSY